MAEAAVIAEQPLRQFCEGVLKKLGVPAEDARITTDVLVVADLRGIESHGVARLGRYVAGLKEGFMRPTDQSRGLKETKATALIDGGQSLGQVVGKRGMDLAIKQARDTAVGGEGEDLGGHKGYGLALMVDVLSGVLSGAATGLQVYADEKRPNVGHFFMALDPAAFRPLDEFRRDMDRLARELKDSPKAHGQERIYVHGEKSFALMEKHRKAGIPLDPKVVENLKKIGADLGIPWGSD